MRQTVAVSLTPELATELDELATRVGASRSEIVRDALRRYLAVQEFRRIRESMLPHAEAAGVFTDDDVFGMTSCSSSIRTCWSRPWRLAAPAPTSSSTF